MAEKYIVSDAKGREFRFEGVRPVVGSDGWLLPVLAPSGAKRVFVRHLSAPRDNWHSKIERIK